MLSGEDISEYQVLCRAKGSEHSVVPDVHEEDFIFRFLLSNPCFKRKDEAVNYYFEDGARAARKLKDLVETVCGIKPDQVELLEFASGFGCVTRHLVKVFPRENITSCDIHEKAVDFCSGMFGVQTLLSRNRPEDLVIGRRFDVVFALSFFSHMPDLTWGRWLAVLLSAVKDGGYLIFTVHGAESIKFLNYPVVTDGYWFKAESEQKDLDANQYGLTITTPEYVVKRLAGCQDAALDMYRKADWWGHQDMYVVKRERNEFLRSSSLEGSQEGSRLAHDPRPRAAGLLKRAFSRERSRG